MSTRRKTLITLLVMLAIAYGLGAFTVWAASNIDITVR